MVYYYYYGQYRFMRREMYDDYYWVSTYEMHKIHAIYCQVNAFKYRWYQYMELHGYEYT